MKFINIFLIFTLLMLSPYITSADEFNMKYSWFWSNTLNIRWNVDANSYLGWLQFVATAEKQKDGSNKCTVHCSSQSGMLLAGYLDVDNGLCGLFQFEAAHNSQYADLYNQITQCEYNTQNSQVVWPIYNEVYKTYKSTGKDKVVVINK